MALKMCLDINIKSLEVEGDSLISSANGVAHQLANEGIK
ncbi:hypothetical protein Golax_014620 [Gossypium laxum]|uniref:Uncharacterized protein n=1 Tax=Gossypium laxum TaxID=34288 RepID=A0A7J8ZWP3_9ROSI|nr:hypothetical protein [Gossypium laxum]